MSDHAFSHSDSRVGEHSAAPLGSAHPDTVLFEGQRRPPALPVCDHYAGNARFLDKALVIRRALGPVFDITLDLEDGAAVGEEERAAQWAVDACRRFDLDARGLGVRIHDVDHPAFAQDLNILLAKPLPTLAYLMLPKVRQADDVASAAFDIELRCRQNGWAAPPALHVLIETPGAVMEADKIAGLKPVESLSFGVMDYVSHFQGAIPEAAMRSPLQFEHPLLVRARTDIALACHRFGKVPSHNVCTQFKDLGQVASDATRARQEFGFLRMWSIHPDQIPVIVSAFAPDTALVEKSAAVLTKAAAAQWGPVELAGELHDRASFRYYWQVLRQAQATGRPVPAACLPWFA